MPSMVRSIKKKILVVGDVMLDRYLIGDVSRISPEAPVPVLSVKDEKGRPGGAANVAANIAAMGGDVTLLAIAGLDKSSTELAQILQDYSINLVSIADKDSGTTQKTRIVAGIQQIVRIDRDVLPSELARKNLLEAFKQQVLLHDIVVFSDYAKGCLDNLPELVSIARASGKITLVDPKRTSPEFYQGVSLLKPNNSEFIALFGSYSSDDELRQMSHDVVARLGLQYLVVTRGQKGMMVTGADGQVINVPTRAREVFDVSGAGDTVLAALATELSKESSIAYAVDTANVAAGVAVSHSGTYIVTKDDIEYQQMLEKHGKSKLLTNASLAKAVNYHRRAGERIVFTNGCFDILHPGHVRLLNAARELGDTLILGVNSDASVRKLKGASRPINHFQHRAEVLLGLNSVDYVVEFDAETPIDLIRDIQPDILVKGGDYVVSEIVGYDLVTQNGGSVVALDFHDGYSTTKTINAIHGKD